MERLSRLITWLSKAYDLWIIAPLAWILLVVSYMFYYPITSRPMKRIAWVFNGWMIWAAFCGWLIWGGISEIQDAQCHRGPGYICVGEDEHYEEVSEAQYRRQTLANGFMLLFMGGIFWVICASGMRQNKAEADHQKALYKWADARARACHAAVFAATDEPGRMNLTRVIESSEEVQDAAREVARTASRLRACQSEE